MPETKTLREGTLRWVAAGSGTGGAVTTGWITASGAPNNLVGYVRAGMNFERGWNYVAVYDRGVPAHQKMTQRNVVEVDFTVLFATTADWVGQNPFVTASGFSVPMGHWEFKQHNPELAGVDVPFTGTGTYYQFHNAVVLSNRFTEAEDGNTLAWKIRAIAVNGPTASGYLS